MSDYVSKKAIRYKLDVKTEEELIDVMTRYDKYNEYRDKKLVK